YAREKFASEPGSDTVRRQHRDYFLSLTGEAKEKLFGPEQGEWLDRLEIEHDNLRAALDWCQQDQESEPAGLRLTAALQPFWDARGYVGEGRERSRAARRLSCSISSRTS